MLKIFAKVFLIFSIIIISFSISKTNTEEKKLTKHSDLKNDSLGLESQIIIKTIINKLNHETIFKSGFWINSNTALIFSRSPSCNKKVLEKLDINLCEELVHSFTLANKNKIDYYDLKLINDSPQLNIDTSFFYKNIISNKEGDPFRKIRMKYPNFNGLFEASLAGLSKDKKNAVIYFGIITGNEQGWGTIYFLIRKGKSWEIIYERIVWTI